MDAAPEIPEVTVELAEVYPLSSKVVALGLRLCAPEGWHLYWGENPGDTGRATRATLSLSGQDAGAPRWTAPSLHVDPGNIRSFIYEPEGWAVWEVAAGPGAALEFRADWLVCRDQCVQGAAILATSLPVMPTSPDPRSRLPVRLEPTLLAGGARVVCLPSGVSAFHNEAMEPSAAAFSRSERGTVSRVELTPATTVDPAAATVFAGPGTPGWRVAWGSAKPGGDCVTVP